MCQLDRPGVSLKLDRNPLGVVLRVGVSEAVTERDGGAGRGGKEGWGAVVAVTSTRSARGLALIFLSARVLLSTCGDHYVITCSSASRPLNASGQGGAGRAPGGPRLVFFLEQE